MFKYFTYLSIYIKDCCRFNADVTTLAAAYLLEKNIF